MKTSAAIYARYSTSRQDPRSIEDQVRRCRKWAAEHKDGEGNGYEVVTVFSDAAISGSSTDRTQFQQLLAAVKSGRAPFKVVIVDDLARLSRHMGDAFNLIFRTFEEAGIVLADVTTGLTSDHPAARATFGALTLVNDMQRESARSNTRRGLEGLALAGFHTGGRIYGYTTIPEPSPSDPERPRKLLKINPKEAAVVLRVFEAYARGDSPREIAASLNRDGIAAPYDKVGYSKPAGHGWGHGTVRAMLRNERYIGRAVYNRRTWKGKRPRLNKTKDVIPLPERVDLVIVKDRSLWDRVQARIGSPRPLGTPRHRHDYRTSPLSGLLRCGVCGNRLQIAGQGKGKYRSFKCAANHSKGAEICPNGTSITENKLIGALAERFRTMLEEPRYFERFSRTFGRLLADHVRHDAAASATAPLDTEIAKEEAKVGRLLALVEAGESGDAPAVLLDRLRASQGRLDALRAQRAAVKVPSPKAAPTAPSPARLRALFDEIVEALTSDAPAGREVLAARLEPVVWTPKNTAEGPVHALQTAVKTTPAALVSDGRRSVRSNGSCGGRI